MTLYYFTNKRLNENLIGSCKTRGKNLFQNVKLVMSSVSLRIVCCLKRVMTQFLTQRMPLVESHLQSSCDVKFSCFGTDNLLFFFFFPFFGLPAAYGVPRPGIRSEMQLQPKLQLP